MAPVPGMQRPPRQQVRFV